MEDGCADGSLDGSLEGSADGLEDGICEGSEDGCAEGSFDGIDDVSATHPTVRTTDAVEIAAVDVLYTCYAADEDDGVALG